MATATKGNELTKRQAENREALVAFFSYNAGNKQALGGFAMNAYFAKANKDLTGLETCRNAVRVHMVDTDVDKGYYGDRIVACPIGYLPLATSRMKERRMTWSQYSELTLGMRCDSNVWRFLFSPLWAKIDNSAIGAKTRLKYWFEHGLPEACPPIETFFVNTVPEGDRTGLHGPIAVLRRMCLDDNAKGLCEIMGGITSYDAAVNDVSLDAAAYLVERLTSRVPEDYKELLGSPKEARFMSRNHIESLSDV